VCNNAEATWYKEIRHALRCTQRQHTALCKHRGYCWSCILQFGLCREAELMLCTKDKLDSQSWHTEMYEQSAMAHGDVWTEMYGTRRCMDGDVWTHFIDSQPWHTEMYGRRCMVHGDVWTMEISPRRQGMLA
jgi:hypothetical protein